MKRFILLFLLFLILFLLHFVFSPINIYKNKIFNINKIIGLDSINYNSTQAPDLFFQNNFDCYYISINGDLINHITAGENQFIKANKYFYAIYNKSGDSITTYETNGKLISTIKTYGYPYINQEVPLLIIINLNGMGFSLYTIRGEILISNINFSSLITSISIDKSYNILVSTIDGESQLFSSNGKLIFETDSDESRIKLSKANTSDFNGNTFALCNGLYPEIIEIYNKKNYNLIAKYKTSSNMRRNIFMKIIGNKIFFEGDGKIEYYDFKRNKSGKINICGTIKNISVNNNEDLLISSIKDNVNCLTIYSLKGVRKFYKEFSEDIESINFYDADSFYFKISNQIIKMQSGAS